MELLLSSLLFASLCALSSWSVSPGTFAVTQTPEVSVKEGKTINITCCWSENVIRARVYWMKNYTVIKISLNGSQSTCSTLTLEKITRSMLGIYICEVAIEIPTLNTTKGRGTLITFDDEGNAGDTKTQISPPLAVILTLAAVVPLLVIALICFCILRGKQAQAARVISEDPHVDSEVADMDKHSTSSSRGSSVWERRCSSCAEECDGGVRLCTNPSTMSKWTPKKVNDCLLQYPSSLSCIVIT
ncbi:uncharacterized protein KZ484_009810 isoform 2-T2 [Pholidichthys leucotaenia]